MLLHEFFVIKFVEISISVFLFLSFSLCKNGKREFICGIYDTSGSAERNLFTSKNSVMKLCSGSMYLGEKLYIASYKETVSQESYYCVEADAFYLL